MWITIYNDSSCKPIGRSIQLDTSPETYLGEPTCKTGTITSWYEGNIVIVLSDGDLTTPT